MIKMSEIRSLSRRIVREFNPHRIVLFGSHAARTATQDSDVDLLVVLPFAGPAVAKSVEMRLRTRPSFPLDLLVRTPEAVRKRIAMGDTFMQEVMTKGKVLHEANDSGMGSEGRRRLRHR